MILTLKLPALVGVPERTPVEEFNFNPLGSPEALHLIVPVPLARLKVTFLYATLTIPYSRLVGEIVSGLTSLIFSFRLFVTVLATLEAVNLIVYVFASVGVPVNIPVSELKLNPSGSPDAVKVIGSVPVTIIFCE